MASQLHAELLEDKTLVRRELENRIITRQVHPAIAPTAPILICIRQDLRPRYSSTQLARNTDPHFPNTAKWYTYSWIRDNQGKCHCESTGTKGCCMLQRKSSGERHESLNATTLTRIIGQPNAYVRTEFFWRIRICRFLRLKKVGRENSIMSSKGHTSSVVGLDKFCTLFRQR